MVVLVKDLSCDATPDSLLLDSLDLISTGGCASSRNVGVKERTVIRTAVEFGFVAGNVEILEVSRKKGLNIVTSSGAVVVTCRSVNRVWPFVRWSIMLMHQYNSIVPSDHLYRRASDFTWCTSCTCLTRTPYGQLSRFLFSFRN